MKCCPTGLELTLVGSQLDHGLAVEDIDAAATVDEGLGEET